MTDKYFTLQIEDLRIGYECERKMNSGWIPCTMDFYDIQLVIIDKRSDWYRVPFLTREQIPPGDWDSIKEEGEGGFSGTKETRGYTYSFLWTTDYILSIWEDKRCLFFGDCRDINTYKLICKLVNI